MRPSYGSAFLAGEQAVGVEDGVDLLHRGEERLEVGRVGELEVEAQAGARSGPVCDDEARMFT